LLTRGSSLSVQQQPTARPGLCHVRMFLPSVGILLSTLSWSFRTNFCTPFFQFPNSVTAFPFCFPLRAWLRSGIWQCRAYFREFEFCNLLVGFASTPADYPRWFKRARTFICDTDGCNNELLSGPATLTVVKNASDKERHKIGRMCQAKTSIS
jgi:hypothetical protein